LNLTGGKESSSTEERASLKTNRRKNRNLHHGIPRAIADFWRKNPKEERDTFRGKKCAPLSRVTRLKGKTGRKGRGKQKEK